MDLSEIFALQGLIVGSVLFCFVQQAVVKTLFLNYFYKRCIHRLMAPLMAQTAGEVVSKGQHYYSYTPFISVVTWFCLELRVCKTK